MPNVVEGLVHARLANQSHCYSSRRENTRRKSNSYKNTFTKADLEACSVGSLFGTGNAQLPSAPLLMLDRIIDIQSTGGKYDRGYAIAELDIAPSLWFFKHHFVGDPVMPGCFLIESLWQLTGFQMAWSGHKGGCRVLDSGRTRFVEMVTKDSKSITISIHIRKMIAGDSPICIADGNIRVSESVVCSADAVKIGLFQGANA